MQYLFGNNVLLGCIINQLESYSVANILSSINIQLPVLLLCKQEMRWYPLTAHTLFEMKLGNLEFLEETGSGMGCLSWSLGEMADVKREGVGWENSNARERGRSSGGCRNQPEELESPYRRTELLCHWNTVLGLWPPKQQQPLHPRAC